VRTTSHEVGAHIFVAVQQYRAKSVVPLGLMAHQQSYPCQERSFSVPACCCNHNIPYAGQRSLDASLSTNPEDKFSLPVGDETYIFRSNLSRINSKQQSLTNMRAGAKNVANLKGNSPCNSKFEEPFAR
jgi:hypothetical protein